MFEPVFDVIGPVMLPETVRYYGKNRAGKAGEDTNAEGMVYDACVAANIDFAPYSWSGDSIVDVVMVVFAGPGENRGGLPENIWPHKNYLTWKELDGMELTQYACVSELRNKARSSMSSHTVWDCLISIPYPVPTFIHTSTSGI